MEVTPPPMMRKTRASQRSASLRHSMRRLSELSFGKYSNSSTKILRRRTIANGSLSKQFSEYLISSGSSSALSSHASFTSLASDTEDVPPDARPVRSSLPHVGFSARNHQWNNVQASILSIFGSCRDKKGKAMYEITFIINEIRELNKTEIGPFIYDYYKNQLIQKGFRSIRESINKEIDDGADLLKCIGETWDFFYKEVLAQLKFVLSSVQIKDLSIHQATLMGFRDQLLLKMNIEDSLKGLGQNVPANIRQMLLVLQNVCESTPPSENFLKLERMVALVVSPYLGYEGLYMGESTPVIKAERHVLYKHQSMMRRRNIEKVGRSISVYVEDLSSDEPPEIIHSASADDKADPQMILSKLAPLKEDELVLRRHSASSVV